MCLEPLGNLHQSREGEPSEEPRCGAACAGGSGSGRRERIGSACCPSASHGQTGQQDKRLVLLHSVRCKTNLESFLCL